MLALVPVIAAVVGLLVYVLATNPKAAEAGRLLFACGVLVALWVFAGHTVRVLP